MAGFEGVLSASNVLDICRAVEVDGKRFLCFTNFHYDKFNLCLSDGIDVWMQDFSESDVEELAENFEPQKTKESLLTTLRTKLTGEQYSIVETGAKISLDLGSELFTFDLYEASSADRKHQLQTVLFRLATKCEHLSEQLDSSSDKIKSLQQQNANVTSTFLDFDSKKKSNQQKAKPMQPGMSVINPASKKRKAARGVVFD